MLSKNIVNWMTMAAISGILVSCATDRPHNDVLIFGTSTKLALDVSAPVQNAGIPEFTLGYKRQEAVWMPLKPSDAETNRDKSARAREAANALTSCYQTLALTVPDLKQRRTICMGVVLPSDKYVSYASGLNADKGGNGGEIDTYSVFASFGASGNLSSSGASGNLAQFFATGIAAQRLGANPGVGVALNSIAPKAIEETKKAEAEKSKEFQALIAGGASPEDAEKLAKGVPAALIQFQKDIEKALTCSTAWKAAGKVPAALSANAQRIVMTSANDDVFKADIKFDGIARQSILTNCK